MTDTLYFAYGSNVDPSGMGRRCPSSVVVGRAALLDWRLTFRGVADVEPHPDSMVEGLLWSCPDEDIKELDYYEGVAGGFYRRERLPIERQGVTYLALVYVMNPTDYDDVSLPSRSYLDSIIRGYTAFGVPMRQVREALASTGDRIDAAGIKRMRNDGRKRMRPVGYGPTPQVQPSRAKKRKKEASGGAR